MTEIDKGSRGSPGEANGRGSQRRKSKKFLEDGTVSWEMADDHLEGRVNLLGIQEKIRSDKYSKEFIRQISGHALNIALFQREGFTSPIFVPDKDGLSIKVPNKGFGVGDVRQAVGSRRQVDVMDVQTQKNMTMTMKEWHKYFDKDPNERTELLNVISLEVSNTKLESQIQSPRVVRQMDWIDKVWPRHLKEMQMESTNSLDDMMYPKVQKYCLMSVKGCWTDFHIDLGGTSVWYHILQGGKIFWLIPPTDENLKKYEEWVLSGKQSDVFFGDMVEKCGRFEIPAGGTFFIPSGWIHAVYTLHDSIVFGGNFLHSYSIEKQLQVAHIEEITHVPNKFRFPFFTEMLWYVLDRYVHCLLGRTHLDLPEEEKRRMKLEKGENIDPNKEVLKINTARELLPQNHTHITPWEIQGLKYIVMYLHHLPDSKKNVPVMLPDPISVIKDIRTVVLTHINDCPQKAATGKSVLRWTDSDDVDNQPRRYRKIPKIAQPPGMEKERKKPGPKPGSSRKPQQEKMKQEVTQDSLNNSKTSNAANKRRRVRCKICAGCVGGDCRECQFCKDMVKYGGIGKMKQTCEKRRCLNPQLPVCAYCSVCRFDGWGNEPKTLSKESERPEEPSSLFECTVCLDIMHPECADRTIGRGTINNDLANSWECTKCQTSGYSSVPSRATKGSLDSEEGEVKKTRPEITTID